MEFVGGRQILPCVKDRGKSEEPAETQESIEIRGKGQKHLYDPLYKNLPNEICTAWEFYPFHTWI